MTIVEKDLAQIKRRVHRLGHLAQSLEFLDRLRELGVFAGTSSRCIRFAFRIATAAGPANVVATSISTRSEWVYLPSPERDDSDDFVIAQHWNGDDAAEPAETLRLETIVVGSAIMSETSTERRSSATRPTSVPCPGATWACAAISDR